MMSSVRQSPSAIARSGATPEFVELCKTLYGDMIDPDAVWEDVLKAGPDQADVNAHQSAGKRALHGVALGSTIAGGILGVKEGASGVKEVTAARRAGSLVPASAYRKLGLAAAATGGDVITTGVLAAQNRKQKIGKAHGIPGLPELPKVIEGHVKQMGALVPSSSDAGKQVIQGKVISGGAKDAGYMQSSSKLGSQQAAQSGAQKPAKSRAYRAGKAVGQVAYSQSGRRGLAAGGAAGVAAGRASKQTGGQDAYYGKADTAEVTWEGTFSKFDDDKRLAFGWASVTKLNGTPVVDRQGDYIDTDDLEEAAYKYVHGSRVGGDMHRRNGEAPHHVSDMVESMVFTDDKIAKMGLPEDFPRGWWVGYRINDEDTWQEVRKGGRTGFSIHGKGIRKDMALDDVMGYQ